MAEMIPGVDCAKKLTSLECQALAGAGCRFVGRYLVPNAGSTAWKALTWEEAHAISQAGLGILAVRELGETRARQGYAAGAADGAKAYSLALELKIPLDAVIYFAVDYDAQALDFPAIAAYLQGARDHLGSYGIGVYGGYALIEDMAARGLCRGYWQTLAWSYGRRSEHLTVYQSTAQTTLAGVTVDLDQCPDLDQAGIWSYEEEVSMTKAEVEELIAQAKAQARREAIEDVKVLLLGQDTKPSDWAKAELDQAVADGITDGTRPQGYATRQEVAMMVMRSRPQAG